MSICRYEGCWREVNSPHYDEFCLFHAPKEKKGILVEQFNHRLFEELKARGNFNCAGFVFPGKIVFSGLNAPVTLANADFRGAQFHGDACFWGAQFDGLAFFEGAQFHGNAHFMQAQFHAIPNFLSAKFLGNAYFTAAQFHGNTFFTSARFHGDALFRGSIFHRTVFFSTAFFLASDNLLNSPSADFSKSIFEKETIFDYITCRGTSLDFSNVRFGPESVFQLRRPKAEANQPQPKQANSPKESLVKFDSVVFREYNAFFTGIKAEREDSTAGDNTEPQNLILIFRHCRLNNVYFSDCDLRFFSFYKSSFDEARFHSNRWGQTPEAERKLIEEEWLERRQKLIDPQAIDKFNESYHIYDLNDRREIATLYRRLKCAHDRTKDFVESGHFYYQECEALRYYYRHEQKGAPARARAALYYFYRCIAGYGEKPLRAFIWLVSLLVVFALANCCIGIYRLNRGADPELTRNLADAVVFTCLRLIPLNLFPFQQNLYEPRGFIGMMTALLNSIVPLVLVTFVLLGLKRRFRRY